MKGSIVAAAAVLALTGCVAVPYDPYYGPHAYHSAPSVGFVYSAPAYRHHHPYRHRHHHGHHRHWYR